MKISPFAPALLLLLLGCVGAAQAEETKPKPNPFARMAPAEQYLMSSAQAEIDLARTAAPPSISADAEVLVLGKHGYESAVKGKNGFVCFVERAWTGGFDDEEFCNPKSRAPNCFNPPAVRSVLPQYVKRSEWAAAGVSRQEMVEKARALFADGHFTMPEGGSFSFMLSRQGYLNDKAGGPWMPHVMFFIPHGQAAIWAAGLEGSPILGDESGPYEPTVLYVPVRRWSDGTPVPPPADPHHKM